MYHLAENLRNVAVVLQPFMPETSEKMFNQLGITDSKLMTWDSLDEYPEYENNIKVVEKGEPLFVRLDPEEEVEFLKNEMNK